MGAWYQDKRPVNQGSGWCGWLQHWYDLVDILYIRVSTSGSRKLQSHSLRLISPGTGNTRSPMVHSPLVPALPPMGGLPPTSTTLKTSTSSWTRPDLARERATERLAFKDGIDVGDEGGMDGSAWAIASVRRRFDIDSRRARRRSLSKDELVLHNKAYGYILLSLSLFNVVNPLVISSSRSW